MITLSRKYELIVKANTSAYLLANIKVIVPGPKIIGSSITGVNKMISLSNELKVLMPSIIGLSSTSSDWDKMVKRYWDSLSEQINPIGKTLETGFTYDMTDTSKTEYIIEINKQIENNKGTKITTDEGLKNYIYERLTKVEETYNITVINANKLQEREKEEALKDAYDTKYNAIWNIEADHYKVGTPINPFEYLLWKYCLVYGDVANEFSFANKSTKIRFYLSSEDAKRELERIKIKTTNQAMAAYLKIIASRNEVINILFAMGLGDIIFNIAKTASGEDLDLQLHVLLKNEMDKDPAKFIASASDKNVAYKGLVEKYIAYNVLRRLQGTNIIVDYSDSAKVIGSSLEDAVSYFNNKENAAYISELETKFKDLNSKLETPIKKVEDNKPNIGKDGESKS